MIVVACTNIIASARFESLSFWASQKYHYLPFDGVSGPGVDFNVWPESFPELGHVGAAVGVFIRLDVDDTPRLPQHDGHYCMGSFVEGSECWVSLHF